MMEETDRLVAGESDDDDVPLVSKRTKTSSGTDAPVPLQMVHPPPPSVTSTKRKRTGRTKSVAKRHKTKDLEA